VSPYITTAKGASVNGADMTLAGKYISAGIFAGAESELKLLARKEVNAKIYNLLGYALQRQNKLEEALEVFEKSVRMKGSKPDAFVNLSQIYLAKNETEKAVIYAKKALAVKKSALSYNQMGLARLKLGHAKEAAKDFAEAYKMTPSFIPSYINEAIVHIDFIKNPMAAIDILNRAISVDSENADVFYQMGRAMNKMGMLEQAAASFNQAIQLDRAYKSIVTREIVKMSKLRVKKII
ncbi:MAG: tetratricopeptide repeat protein, partial [Elusimicrobiales bacterium]|nr:tetratricopeptide repeat protein [Elusimicrobiales bacterium]